ncbi:LIN37 family protein [Acanthocheilonema viteae]
MSSSEKVEDIVLPVCEPSVNDASAAANVSPWKANVIQEKTLTKNMPESPDMKFARTRFGHLLDGIRSGEIQTGMQARNRARSPEEMERDLLERSKKSLRRESRRMVFELRGKPFALRDSGRREGVYALCRNWMRGSDDERPKEKREIEHPEPPDDSLDLLATKEIYALPRPHDRIRIEPAPSPLYISTKIKVDTTSSKELLDVYLPHWKRIKKNWNEYSRIRDRRYQKSIRLLNTVFSMNQQNSII